MPANVGAYVSLLDYFAQSMPSCATNSCGSELWGPNPAQQLRLIVPVTPTPVADLVRIAVRWPLVLRPMVACFYMLPTDDYSAVRLEYRTAQQTQNRFAVYVRDVARVSLLHDRTVLQQANELFAHMLQHAYTVRFALPTGTYTNFALRVIGRQVKEIQNTIARTHPVGAQR